MALERGIYLLSHWSLPDIGSQEKPLHQAGLFLLLCSLFYCGEPSDVKNEKWLRKHRFDREPKGDTVSYPRHKRIHIKENFLKY